MGSDGQDGEAGQVGVGALWAKQRQGAQGFLFEADREMRFRYVSAAVTEVCGYVPSELIGEGIARYVADPDSRFSLIRAWHQLKSGEATEIAFTLKYRHKKGHAVILDIVCRGCAGDAAAAVYGFASDATKRRSADTQLRLSDQILNTIDTMVLVVNGEGQIIYVSPSVTRILGFEVPEVLGYGWWRHLGGDHPSQRRLRDEHARYARGEAPVRSGVREEKVRDKAGQMRWMMWQDAKGPQDLMIGVGQDITEYKKVNDALANSTQKLRAIFETTEEGMLIVDDAMRYVEANPAACGILGRSREEVVGREVGTFSQDAQATREALLRVLNGEASTGATEVPCANGTVRQIEYIGKKNILPGMHLVVSRDVTERRRLELQLQQAQKMEAVGQLAGGVAHDFNNMLTVIRGYCELLQRKLPPESEYRRYADFILNASDKATMTTQQLLAFSRRQVIQAREINLNNVVQDMGKLLQRLIGEDMQLRISLDEKLGTIMADSGQMGQILLNLAVNARDAMPNGGVITIETENVSLDETYARTHLKMKPGEYVMMSVTDNGCGMSREVLERIFEPFFTTKPAGKGTGLGLSTVYGIIEQARGAVYVYSEPGEGTAFKVYFPRTDKISGQSTSELDDDGGSCCVLVIDDDVEAGEVLVAALENHGYRVLNARSGGEALQLCSRHTGKIELVISDITMPGADGMDIQGYFEIEHPEAKMIYVSGYTKRSLRDRGILTPEAAFLQKPFRWEDLRLLIDEVTGAKERSQVQ